MIGNDWMKQYRLNFLHPQDMIIEAVDMQAAHNRAKRIIDHARRGEKPTLMSIEEVVEEQLELKGTDE